MTEFDNGFEHACKMLEQAYPHVASTLRVTYKVEKAQRDEDPRNEQMIRALKTYAHAFQDQTSAAAVSAVAKIFDVSWGHVRRLQLADQQEDHTREVPGAPAL